ncbi:alpha/beta-hydrolase [Phellopilus nigrolimitatus]|nr:alpha/beta-hydrolase [Phellopilus nigrolimitatus]
MPCVHAPGHALPKTFLVLLLACTLAGAADALPALSSPLGPVVNLGYAAFAGNSTSPEGQADGPVTFFGGIPYAQPPLGDLRFRAPAPLDERVVDAGSVPVADARNWGPACIQQPAVVGVGSEDCLKLNIWKPSDAKEGDKLPVIFYIHGGGNIYGTPQGFPLYDWVNQSSPKIVGVSVGYRLGLLGFLAGTAVQADGAANAGLLDQRAALEWVQRHIARFGGDPGAVTIDGESAGGANVVIHIVSYGGTKPAPFRGGIAQSIGYGPVSTTEEADALFENVTGVVGCPSTGAQAMPCLRNASVGALVAAINNVAYGRISPGPVVDGPGGFLPALPSALIAAGNFSAVAFVGGHCTNDGRTFVGGTPAQFVTDADIAALTFGRLGEHVTEELIQEALALYPAPGTPGSPYATQYARAAEIAQDTVFSCMDWFLAQKLQEKGVENVFTYRFNTPDPIVLAEFPYEGVMHTSDLFFLFDACAPSDASKLPNAGANFTAFNEHNLEPFIQTEAPLSQEAIAFWTSFVSSGDPSTSRAAFSPAWPGFATGARMVLTEAANASASAAGRATASGMEDTPASQIQRCEFWMSLNVTAQTRV